STVPEHKEDVRRAAQFVADEMKRIGMEHVEVIPTSGHPLVYGDWLHAAGKATVLCYGHYDVQPPDPLNEWHTPPFEPTERNQNIYARGAVDDKGQMYMHVKALERIISKLKDENGKILIPHFYDRVQKPNGDELQAWKSLPFNEEHYRKTEVGSKELTGEAGYTVLERTWARPTLEVHGMPGGFTAAGAKTVIPAKAAAKVSMRLVPNQDPDDILKRYTNFV